MRHPIATLFDVVVALTNLGVAFALYFAAKQRLFNEMVLLGAAAVVLTWIMVYLDSEKVRYATSIGIEAACLLFQIYVALLEGVADVWRDLIMFLKEALE